MSSVITVGMIANDGFSLVGKKVLFEDSKHVFLFFVEQSLFLVGFGDIQRIEDFGNILGSGLCDSVAVPSIPSFIFFQWEEGADVSLDATFKFGDNVARFCKARGCCGGNG